MRKIIFAIHRALFARKFFYKFNRLTYVMSLHGLGILNYETNQQSGEDYFLWHELRKFNCGVILDVGANVGDYCALIKYVNPEYSIYAFEPHPNTYKRLVENTKKLNIKVFNLGVGATEGSFALYDYASGNGSEHASLHKDVIEKIHKGTAVEHRVKVISLDTFATQNQIDRITLLKIDTEGNEFEVLKGAKELLSSGKIQMIQLEFNEMNVVSSVFFKDIWDFLPNYDFYRMLPDGLLKINEYEPIFCEIFAYQNIVAKLKETK